jgi:multidrug resistance protein
MPRRGAGPSFLVTPLGIVVSTVVIDLIGFGIVLPLLPLYAERFGASPVEIGFITASYALAQFVFAPVWGRLSDRIGRRPVILASLAGTCAASLTLGLANALWLLFLARVVDGASGASYAAAQAYVADVTGPEDRARGMGLIGAAFGLGFIVGPALGAAFAGVDARLPFLVAAALAGGNLLLAARRLPESRRPGAAAVLPRRRDLLARALTDRGLAPLVWISFVGTFAFVAMESTFALFGEARLDYGLTQTGAIFAYIGVVAAVTQGGLVGRVVRRHGERRVLVAGLALTGLSLALVPACYSTWALVPVAGLMAAASGLVFPTVTSLISKGAGEDAQGGILGIAASTGGLARILAPPIALVLFQHVGVATPYLVGAVLFAACAGIAAGGRARPAVAAGGLRSGPAGGPRGG